jgi:hypothetical protein
MMPTGIAWCAINWNGSQFLATAQNSAIYATSPNGSVWTSRTFPVRNTYQNINWNGSQYAVPATPSNFINISSDGINWTTNYMPNSRSWHTLSWNGSYYIVPALSSTLIAVSKDGESWRELNIVTAATNSLRSILWNGQSFIALNYGGDNFIKITPDTGNFRLPAITTNIGGFASGYVGNYWIKT